VKQYQENWPEKPFASLKTVLNKTGSISGFQEAANREGVTRKKRQETQKYANGQAGQQP